MDETLEDLSLTTKYTLKTALKKDITDLSSAAKVKYLKDLYTKESGRHCPWGFASCNEDLERYTEELMEEVSHEKFMKLVRQMTMKKFSEYYDKTWKSEDDPELKEDYTVQDFIGTRFNKTVQKIVKRALQNGIPQA
jgi:chromosomal replication initiation ATPase DnaA